MRVVDTRSLESRDDAIEFDNAWNGADAHSVHSAARDFIVAYEYLAITAAAQFFHEPLGVLRIAERACLNEKCTRDGNCGRDAGRGV